LLVVFLFMGGNGFNDKVDAWWMNLIHLLKTKIHFIMLNLKLNMVYQFNGNKVHVSKLIKYIWMKAQIGTFNNSGFVENKSKQKKIKITRNLWK
jgi:hypothetical protein